ncbi:hypothetical protein EV424DRAFT_1441923 [Suillus variegatus]|nr:hypothetical protein EV424DRAFT_1441923 [Suillus variegatus]
MLTEVAALMTFPLSTCALEQASGKLGSVGCGSLVWTWKEGSYVSRQLGSKRIGTPTRLPEFADPETIAKF